MLKKLYRHPIRTYHCKSFSETHNFLEMLKRVTPHMNDVESTLKIVDIIQQTKMMISEFIFIFQQHQTKFKDLDLNKMSVKMSDNFKKMKTQALNEYEKLMHDLECDKTDPSEDLIFVKYRLVHDRIRHQVLIELDFNKFLS